MKRFTILSRPDCVWCEHAKSLLALRGQEFTEISHDTPEKIADFKRQGYSTFPQVIMTDEEGAQWCIGGFADLDAYYRRLDKAAHSNV